VIALAVARLIGRRHRAAPQNGYEILLTGRFDSANWILNHLGPLGASSECSRVWMVSTNRVPELSKVKAIYPPPWLVRVAGAGSEENGSRRQGGHRLGDRKSVV